jgi:hypothetical protein
VSTSSDLTTLSNADQWDIAIVSSENKTYVLSQAPYSTASNWKQILSPTGWVTSVNGQTWAVTVSEFTPWWTATTGYIVTKTASGYEWSAPSGWDVLVSTQANNIFTPWMKIWGWTTSDYQSLTPDSNTAYLLLADTPTPPSPWWQPWVNTIGYRPLTDDYDDYSGNGYDFNSNSTNLTTVDWVKCCDLGTSYCDANITITTLPYTIAFYCKIKNTSARWIDVLFAEWGWWGWSWVWASTSNIYIRYGNVTDTDQTWSFTPDWDWHLYVATFSATWGWLYIDWQLFQTLKNPQSDPDTNGTPFYIGHDNGNHIIGNAYMWAVILEDKARSAQDVSDYYDLTKWDYWIS